MQLSSEGWTVVGGVNGEGPADDDDTGDVVVVVVDDSGDGATVAFLLPPLGDVATDICSMTTLIRLLLEGRRSPFFFNLPIFACDHPTARQ